MPTVGSRHQRYLMLLSYVDILTLPRHYPEMQGLSMRYLPSISRTSSRSGYALATIDDQAVVRGLVVPVRVNGLHLAPSPMIVNEPLLYSAKSLGLSVECVLPSSLRPHPLKFTAAMDSGDGWQLSRIWAWDKSNPEDIGPLAVLLPVGLYGKISAYLLQMRSTAPARRIHGGFLTVSLDHVSGRETIFWGSLGSGDNVCTMPFPPLFSKSCLLALWRSPYTWSPSLWVIQYNYTQTVPTCRSFDLCWSQPLGASMCFSPQF
jgi:hypothetical protein